MRSRCGHDEVRMKSERTGWGQDWVRKGSELGQREIRVRSSVGYDLSN